MLTIIVTGIGMHTAERLLRAGHEVVGLDNVNDYYDTGLKRARLKALSAYAGFAFHELGIENAQALGEVFGQAVPQRVVHLAAQAGVRYSLTHPQAYADSNLQGFVNMLEACRHAAVPHLTYASTSSVYGANTIDTRLHDGSRIRIDQQTDYPWTGRIILNIREADGRKKSI
jgi:UDP-glucuronate 4-epimerase